MHMTTINLSASTQKPATVRIIRTTSKGYTHCYGGINREEEIPDSEHTHGEIIFPSGAHEEIHFNTNDGEWERGAVETVALRRALEIEKCGIPVILQLEGYDAP
jgi:hypothetical protein